MATAVPLLGAYMATTFRHARDTGRRHLTHTLDTGAVYGRYVYKKIIRTLKKESKFSQVKRHPCLSGFSWFAHRDYRMLADVLPALMRSARPPSQSLLLASPTYRLSRERFITTDKPRLKMMSLKAWKILGLLISPWHGENSGFHSLSLFRPS